MKTMLSLSLLSFVFASHWVPTARADDDVAKALKSLLELKTDEPSEESLRSIVDYCNRAKILVRNYLAGSGSGVSVLRVDSGPAQGNLQVSDLVLIAAYKDNATGKVEIVPIGRGTNFVGLCDALNASAAGNFVMLVARAGKVVGVTITLP